ncbi:MAG: dehydrogenase [Planctomycetaceae bacterium]|nr:MAG: dehydrogenase [Planctomycetaceae bacterium]
MLPLLLRRSLVGLALAVWVHGFAVAEESSPIELQSPVDNAGLDPWNLQQPFWEGSTVFGESVLFVQDSTDQQPTATLLLEPSGIIRMVSADRTRTFKEGRDYLLDSDTGRLTLPPGSRIPFLTDDERFPPVGGPRSINHKAGDPTRGVLFDNGHWFHDQQVEVTYQTRDRWEGYRPEVATKSLARTLDKLGRGAPLRIAVTGDSITFGLNASKRTDVSPHQPTYPELVVESLRASFGSDIEWVNNAVSGWRLEQGLQHLDDLLAPNPDLVIVAYGMNHFGARDAEAFRELQAEMLERILASSPDTEVILVAPMHGNPDWVHTPADQYEPHRDALASLVGPRVALADLTTLWGQMLERKRVTDLTGNGVNHPNDFGHRLYASVILGLLRRPFNTEKSTATPMSPEETVRTAILPEGFELTVFAAEPDVQNPIAITTDERGRLWVAENYTWAGASLGQFRTDLNDRIVILEDVDGDGKHDRRTVFADGLKKLTSVEVGFGGVWALTPPTLVFIPDADRDDVPDGPAIVVLDGFDDHDVSHNVANGLRWGPDGWLYGRHGIMATSSIGRPGTGESQRVPINTGVWRYHPVSGVVEDVFHGMTNSWGHDHDRHGELFCINTVIGHLWHAVPGARSERMYGVDRNPHAYQLIEQVADHFHWDTGETWNQVQKGISDTTMAAGGGHAHIGMMIYQGDNWPESYRDRVYTLNLHGRRINRDRLERLDSHFVAKHEPDLAIFADPFFRGMELLTGPDGGVLIADWSDTGECHDHDGVHRSSGRIYKLFYGQPSPVGTLDLATATEEQLLDALSAPNAWWGRQALRILQERYTTELATIGATNLDRSADPTAPQQLRARLHELLSQTDAETPVRLRVAWALQATGGCDPEALLALTDESLRVWGVRLIAERLVAGEPAAAKSAAVRLAAIAEHDPSDLVALYLASTMQRLPAQDRWQIANALASRQRLFGDRTYSIMVWLGIEPAVPQSPADAIALAGASRLPLLTQNISRRLTMEIESDPPAVERLLSIALRGETAHPDQVIVGMGHALRGWRSAPQPTSWNAVAGKFPPGKSTELDRALRELSVVFGDGRAIEELQAIATDGKADPTARRQALEAILLGRPPEFAPTLQRLAGDRAVMVEALRGLAAYDDPATPNQTLKHLRIYSPEARAELITTLASRPAYAKSLLQAVRAGQLAANEISAFHARQIREFGDKNLVRELIEVWGDVRATDQEKVERIAQLKQDLSNPTDSPADPAAGRLLFQQVCANCHVLFGEGKKVGPDLTGSNRSNLDYLLENILDPSASVGAEFRATLFSLEDGRIVSGVIREQTERTVVIQTAQEMLTIQRSEIEDSRVTTASLMPDGLLQNLSPEQIRDLFAYLRSTEPVPLP